MRERQCCCLVHLSIHPQLERLTNHLLFRSNVWHAALLESGCLSLWQYVIPEPWRCYGQNQDPPRQGCYLGRWERRCLANQRFAQPTYFGRQCLARPTKWCHRGILSGGCGTFAGFASRISFPWIALSPSNDRCERTCSWLWVREE